MSGSIAAINEPSWGSTLKSTPLSGCFREPEKSFFKTTVEKIIALFWLIMTPLVWLYYYFFPPEEKRPSSPSASLTSNALVQVPSPLIRKGGEPFQFRDMRIYGSQNKVEIYLEKNKKVFSVFEEVTVEPIKHKQISNYVFQITLSSFKGPYGEQRIFFLVKPQLRKPLLVDRLLEMIKERNNQLMACAITKVVIDVIQGSLRFSNNLLVGFNENNPHNEDSESSQVNKEQREGEPKKIETEITSLSPTPSLVLTPSSTMASSSSSSISTLPLLLYGDVSENVVPREYQRRNSDLGSTGTNKQTHHRRASSLPSSYALSPSSLQSSSSEDSASSSLQTTSSSSRKDLERKPTSTNLLILGSDKEKAKQLLQEHLKEMNNEQDNLNVNQRLAQRIAEQRRKERDKDQRKLQERGPSNFAKKALETFDRNKRKVDLLRQNERRKKKIAQALKGLTPSKVHLYRKEEAVNLLSQIRNRGEKGFRSVPVSPTNSSKRHQRKKSLG